MYLTGKNGPFVGDKINVNQNIGTRQKSRHGQVICQLFEVKRFFLIIGNLVACICRDLFNTGWPMESRHSAKPIAGRVNSFLCDILTRFQMR